jgi:hypothetical protein
MARARTSRITFALEDLFQEFGIARVLTLRRALRDGAIEIGQRAEPQLLGQRHDALMLEGVHATPPRSSSS